MNKVILRSLVETYQDFQKMRIAVGNRLVANFLYKMGQMPSKPLEDEKAESVLKFLKNEYKRLTDAVAELTSKAKRLKVFKKEGILINEDYEYMFVDFYFRCLDMEKQIVKEIEYVLEDFPVWTHWLADVEGVGPTIGGYIISYLDPHKAKYPSSFWKYCGLHVVDGKAPRRERGKKLDFNTKLRTKLLGVLGDQFVKRPRSYYGQIYRDYRHRLDNHPKWKGTTPGHRYRAAVRYAVKIFLRDLWVEWRKLEGLPVVPDYAEAKLGIVHREAA